MNYPNALQAVAGIRKVGAVEVGFVTPIVAGMLASECASKSGSVVFTKPEAENYARTTGLLEAVNGRYRRAGERRGLAGVSYSPLARLETHNDVEYATDTITECLHTQLGGSHPQNVGEVARVVGELHDNVASHSGSAGFSALQVYKSPARVEFAIVDAGVGLLRNAQKVAPEVVKHSQAIRWCFRKGTTSAGRLNDMAQRLEAGVPNPYPASVQTRSNENNHLGEGLWSLLQLVGELHGELWVLTGDAYLHYSPRRQSYSCSGVEWQGVALEVCLPIGSDQDVAGREDLSTIARRFKL